MRTTALILAAAAGLAGPTPARAADAPGVEFFEKKVRPVLADHCYSCHGPKKAMAGLRLDSAEAIRKGTDEGPVMVPGEPAKSKLVTSVKRTNDYPMPPTKPLPAEAVAALEAWVKLGAPLPTEKGPLAKPGIELAKSHWAFVPVADPPVPATKTDPGSTNPLDRFVLAQLEAKGQRLSPPADRRTLIRRAYFDLIGLPPTAAEVEAFVNDPDPNAFAKVVDKLLASPHYGERWGRHWLDLARYGDSKGYVFTEERSYPYAYTYRDYVIRSFNEDLPYDQFIIEQIAADRLPKREDNQHLAAMGFLTVGRRFMNNQFDIIDDRLDVVFRGLMGLTVTCARCHDHKYDPIPTADYYSLAGAFLGAQEPKDLPYLEPDEKSPNRVKFETTLAAKRKLAADFEAKMYAEFYAKYRTADAVAAYLLAAREAKDLSPEKADAYAMGKKIEIRILNRWREVLKAAEKKPDPVSAAWLALAALPAKDFAKLAPWALAKLATAGPKPGVHPLIAAALREKKPRSLNDVAAVYGKLLAEAFAAKDKADPQLKPLADALLNATTLPTAIGDKLIPIAVKKEWRKLRNDADKFAAESPLAPGRAMALFDPPSPHQPHVFLRGNPNSPGPKVPRQFLTAFSAPAPTPFKDGSGRLDLANAIASKDNPLTARVFVNRAWGHHFGRGIVDTPSDFGVRTEKPVHAALLDWLAARFVEDGWSVKKLHRRIMLSAAYQQASGPVPSLAAIDPENRLFGRQNRQRLEFEPLRDAMLAAAGALDATVHGKSVDIFKAPFVPRRTVYASIDRQNLPGVLRVFDFASPDQHTPNRFLTTVPQQALFLMNSAFVTEQAKAVAARPEVASATAPDEKARHLYRAVLSRDPSPQEVKLATDFAGAAPKPAAGQLGAWELVAQVLLLSNEFAFAD